MNKNDFNNFILVNNSSNPAAFYNIYLSNYCKKLWGSYLGLYIHFLTSIFPVSHWKQVLLYYSFCIKWWKTRQKYWSELIFVSLCLLSISASSFRWAHEGSALPFLASQFNFLHKSGLFSYFAPDITISHYCMSSIRSKPSKQLLIVCWMTSRPQFTASKALFSRAFAGFDELEWVQGSLTFSKMSKGLRQCRDDVDLREKERQKSSGFRVECYHLSGDVYSVRFKPWDGERPAFWVLVEENKGFWCLLAFGLMQI